jgi:hypothetical protein
MIKKVLKKIWHIAAPYKFRKLRGNLQRNNKMLNGDVHKYQAIFVHIPKVAGSSIGTALYGHDKPGHHPISMYHKVFGDDIIKYFTFTFVRDPVDRFLSAYNYLKSGPKNDSDIVFAKNTIEKFEDINDFVINYMNEKTLFSHVHFYPQVYFIKHEGIINIDFIGHYENLICDFSKLTKILNLSIELPHKNKTKKKDNIVLNNKAHAKLLQLYANDYKELYK